MGKGERRGGLARVGARLLFGAAVIGVAALLGWGFLLGRNEAAVEAERDQPVKAPLRVSNKDGTAIVTVDAETQERSGIETEKLSTATVQQQVRAYGMVLDVARLTALSNNYATAKTQLQTAQAKLAMSKPAFERAQKLFDTSRAVSLAQMQSAEAAFVTDQASVAAAEAQLRTLAATAYQEWGAVLGKSLVEDSPVITRLIEREDFLLQITLPPGANLATPPATATVEPAKGKRAEMTFVSPATRMDPKIQGLSFFYTTRAESGVIPGMNILAFLPSGSSVTGVIVPASAIVWWQDRAWVYRRIEPETFARIEIATDLPAPDGGGYVVKDLPPDAQIVTHGAQLLLSEEFRAQIQVDEDK